MKWESRTTDVVCGYPSDVSLHNPVCVFLSLLKNRSEHRAVQAATLANMLLWRRKYQPKGRHTCWFVCCPELSWEQPSSESLRFWKEGQAHLIFCLLKLNLTDCSFVILCIYRNWLELGAYLFGGDNRHTNETELLYLCHVFIHAAPINLGFADRTMHTDCFLIKDIKVDGLRVDDKECV